jgi:hypothetical protein
MSLPVELCGTVISIISTVIILQARVPRNHGSILAELKVILVVQNTQHPTKQVLRAEPQG